MTKVRGPVQRFCLAAAAVAVSMSVGAQPQDARILYARGLTALHLFEYEDANDAFVRAQRADPSWALAYWGEAMTYNQTLWRKEDVAAARQALARLAPTPAARAEKGS